MHKPFGTMDAQITKRLAMALAAKGVNMKQAGLAAGLSGNYVRDVIRRGRGKFELLEKLALANGLSWLWLKTGEGQMYAVAIKHQLELAPEKQRLPSPEAATDGSVNILVNRAALLHALQMFGASEEEAVRAVEFLALLARRKRICHNITNLLVNGSKNS
jgi:hypothetical protein